MQELDCRVLSRKANVARVRPALPLDPDPINPLLDTTLASMSTGGFVLSGVEDIDGCLSAQS